MYSPPDTIGSNGIQPIGRLFRYAWICWATLGVALGTMVMLAVLGGAGSSRSVQLNARGVEQAWAQALADNLALPLLIIGLVAGIGAIVLSACWLYRAHRNVERLGLPTRFGGMTVAVGMLIPGLNLVWPWLGLQSVARAVRVSRAPLYVAWTLLCLEALLYITRAYNVQMQYGKLGESLQTALVLTWMNTLTFGVAAGMLAYLAFQITARQDARLFYEPWTSERDAFDQIDIEATLRARAQIAPASGFAEVAPPPAESGTPPKPRVRSNGASGTRAPSASKPASGMSGKPASARPTPKSAPRPPSPGN